MEIRTLRADEIECRVQIVKENGCSLLLYKDARCDMRILDEVFGVMGWERQHELINGNLFCTVKVWDADKQMWISKQDVGTESYTEKEKGQASDSFKRACFNLGIGRELYTSPFIWINLNANEVNERMDGNKKKYNVKTRFAVKEIGYNDKKEIIKLVVIDNKGKERYRTNGNISTTYGSNEVEKIDKNKVDTITQLAKVKKISESYICKFYKAKSFNDMTVQNWTKAMDYLKKK